MQSGAEQFMDKIDSRKRQDAAEQSRSWSRAICGRKRFWEKTECYLAEQFLKGLESQKKKQGASEQSNLWKGKIPVKAKMLQSRKTRETRIIIAVKKLTQFIKFMVYI